METYPSPSFYFELHFKNEKIAFKEVSGISVDFNVDEDTPTEDHFKLSLSSGVKHGNLTLKRGMLPSNSKFFEWCNGILQGDLSTAIQPHDVSVALLDSSGGVLMKWTFHRAWPVKWSISDFKSEENNLIVESIELTYNYFERVSTN